MPLFNIQSTKYRYSTNTDTQLVQNMLDSTSVAKLLTISKCNDRGLPLLGNFFRDKSEYS